MIAPNAFDIYLPEWLAHHNKQIFGTLFIVGEFVLLASWLRAHFEEKRRTSRNV